MVECNKGAPPIEWRRTFLVIQLGSVAASTLLAEAFSRVRSSTTAY